MMHAHHELTPLPPGQHLIETFPRYGTHLSRPVPDASGLRAIAVDGAVSREVEITIAELTTLPRREIIADFHCVAGWSVRGLRWDGVPFRALYRTRIAPLAHAGVTHLRFVGVDGFRAVLMLDDALSDDVMIADHLNGERLGGDHGGPARLVCPSRYGYKSTKHLTKIELHTAEPSEGHSDPRINTALNLVKPHPRARVADEERHRYLPGWSIRWINYHVIHPIIRRLCDLQTSSREIGMRA
jgi:DMSO/TMAO reductase YedYZ molybdopterin-dependent catalytic subunit